MRPRIWLRQRRGFREWVCAPGVRLNWEECRWRGKPEPIKPPVNEHIRQAFEIANSGNTYFSGRGTISNALNALDWRY